MPTLNIIIGLSHLIFGILVSLEQSQAVWVGLLWSLVVSGGILRSEVVTDSLGFGSFCSRLFVVYHG